VIKTSINDIIQELRQGKIDQIELYLDYNGQVNKIMINNAMKKQKEVRKVSLKGNKLPNVNFSQTRIKGNFSGLTLSGSNFSYSTIETADFSSTNLYGADFNKAKISQTNMSSAYNANLGNAYMTGSVNLYNVNPENTHSYNPRTTEVKMLDDTQDINRVILSKRNY
jgi:uncharacterized protein YjbI with pentapeptide repeats